MVLNLNTIPVKEKAKVRTPVLANVGVKVHSPAEHWESLYLPYKVGSHNSHKPYLSGSKRLTPTKHYVTQAELNKQYCV